MTRHRYAGPQGLLAAALLGLLAPHAHGIVYEAALTFPDLTQEDDVGVDIVSGLPILEIPALRFAGGARQVNFSSVGGGFFAGSSLAHNYLGTVQGVVSDGWYADPARRAQVVVSFGGQSERFYRLDSGYVSVNGAGLLTSDSTGYDYTSREGTRVRFLKNIPFRAWLLMDTAVAVSATSPTGATTRINWTTDAIYLGTATSPFTHGRIQSVEFSDGFMLKFSYEGNRTAPEQRLTESWLRQSSVTAINRTTTYCAPLADSCLGAAGWPSATLGWATSTVWLPNTSNLAPNELTVTQPNGATTKVKTNKNARISSIKDSKSTTYATSYEYCGELDAFNCYWWNGTDSSQVIGRMLKATRNGQNWSYSISPQQFGNYIAIFSSYGPRGTKSVVRRVAQNSGPLHSVSEVDGHTVSYAANDRNLPTSTQTYPLAPMVTSYDARGNLTSLVSEGALPSGAQQRIEKKLTFRTDCDSSDPSCNQPTSSTSPNGAITNFSHSRVHGQLERVDMPSIDGVRASIRHEYAQYQAMFYQTATSIASSGVLEWKLKRTVECTTGAMTAQGDCAIPDATVVTEYDYDTAANLQIKSIRKSWKGESRLSCYTYDRNGYATSQKDLGAASQGGCQ